jgi:hypothetical protein
LTNTSGAIIRMLGSTAMAPDSGVWEMSTATSIAIDAAPK